MAGMSAAEIAALEPEPEHMHGLGNKAIGLRDCRHVRLGGFTILKGGHFAILASGVDHLAIEDLTIDTERDGIDLDCVRNARISRCRVNSPNDDAIVLKSSLALGRAVRTENVVVEQCTVSGYDFGTMIDGTFGRSQEIAPDRDRVTGRIKLGTESNGGFANIAIRDCRFERSRGLALETVDGGVLEDVEISGISMREVTTAPIFLRLGDRRRGPEGTGLGALRRVSIREVEAIGIDPRFAATIAGLPGRPIEDVELRDIRLVYAGGGKRVDETPPILADAYPEPSMFGTTPAWGLWIRDARRVTLRNVRLETDKADGRPEMLGENAEVVRKA
jgi:polygalacturonase